MSPLPRRKFAMQAPPIVLAALRPYYPERVSKPIFVYSTIAYKQTKSGFKRSIPQLLLATKQHMVIYSFEKPPKTLKKHLEQVKVFLRTQIRLVEEKEENVVRVNIMNSEEPIVLKMNNQLEMRSWILLINGGVAPVYKLNIPSIRSTCTSIFDLETVQIEFQDGFRSAKYFSIYPFIGFVQTKKQIARRAVLELFERVTGKAAPEEPQITLDIKNELNVGINLSPLTELLKKSKTFELEDGNMVPQPKMLVDQNNQPVKKIYATDLFQAQLKQIPDVANWQEAYQQFLGLVFQKLHEMNQHQVKVDEVFAYLDFLHQQQLILNPPTQYDDSIFFSPAMDEAIKAETIKPENTTLNVTIKPNDKPKSTRTSMIGEDEVDMKEFMNYQQSISTDLQAKLLQNTKQQDSGKENNEDALTFQISRFLNLMGIFRQQSTITATTMISEFCKFTHEKTLIDADIIQQSGQYYPNVYSRIYKEFQQAVQRLRPNEISSLEDRMVRLGPVHGSLFNFGAPGYEAVSQLLQQKQIAIGDQFMMQGTFGKTTNGFPGENFEQAVSDQQLKEIRFPNQLPPNQQVVQNNVRATLATSRELHCKLNIRRDIDDLLDEDNIALKRYEFEQEIAQALLSSETVIQIPISCLVTFMGFSVMVQPDIKKRTVCGLDDQGLYVIPENRENMEKVGDILNLEQHLISVQSPNQLIQSEIMGRRFDMSCMLDLLIDQLEKEKVYVVSQFIATYQADLIEQLTQCKYQHVYGAQELQQSSILINTPLSGLATISEGNILQNGASLMIPDLPSQYVKLLGDSTPSDRKKLSNFFGANRLPVNFCQIVDQRLNPDATLTAFMTDSVELTNLQKQLVTHLTDLSQKQTGVIDIQLFLKYTFGRLQKIQTQRSIDAAVRWSDAYRTAYLPLLMKEIDNEIECGTIRIDQVILVFEELHVPEYLWAYTANFSSLTEVYDIIKLDVVSKAAASLLNNTLRKAQRRTQQFGLSPALRYAQKSMNEIEEMFREGTVDNSYLASLEAERLNYFTGSEQQRAEMLNETLVLVTLQFLNQMFGLESEGQSNFYQTLNVAVQKQCIQHSFGQYYSKQVNEQVAIGERQLGFDFGEVNRSSLFGESNGIKLESLSPKYYYDKPHAYRQILLEKVCQRAGILLADSSKWDFSRQVVFYSRDFIKFIPITKMALPSLIKEQFQVPYNPIINVIQEVAQRVRIQFSAGSSRITDFDPSASCKKMLKMRDEPDASETLKQMRALHLNFTYFQEITNIGTNEAFEQLFADLAKNLTLLSQKLFADLKKKGTTQLEMIYQYVDSIDCQKTLAAAALSLCRRNSSGGSRVYSRIEQMLTEQVAFLKEIEQASPGTYALLQKELLQQSAIFEKTKKIPNSPEEAFAIALRSACTVFGKSGYEVSKLKQQYAHGLERRKFNRQALEQLVQVEKVLKEQVAKDSQVLGQLYYALGLHFDFEGRCVEALRSYEAALDVFWRRANLHQQEDEKLKSILRNMEARILSLADEKVMKPKKGGLKLINDADANAPQLSTQAVNAKVLLEPKTALDEQLVQQAQIAMQNPVEARLVLVQAVLAAKQKIQVVSDQLNADQLVLAQIYYRSVQTMRSMGTGAQLSAEQIRNLSKQALQMRARVLGRPHSVTLESLYQTAEIDLQAGATEQAAAAAEFILQTVSATQPGTELPVSVFQCFRLLVSCAMGELSQTDQRLLGLLNEQAQTSGQTDQASAQLLTRELLEAESVVDGVHELFRAVREDRSKEAAQKLLTLVKLMNQESVTVENQVPEELDERAEEVDFAVLARKAAATRRDMDY